MRKVLVPSVIALVLALALPGVASAAKTKSYAGAVTGGGTVSFKVVTKVKKKGKKKKKTKYVNGFTFAGVPVTCTDGLHTTQGIVTFAVKLKGTFKIRAESSATGASLEVNGSTASGTLRVAGNVPIDGTQTQGSACESGVLSWSAALQ